MNLLDLYEMRDQRDAYERDVDNSQVGMNRQSRADVTGEEEPSGVFTVVINGKPWKTGSSNEMFALAGRIANKHTDKKIAVKWPTGELNTVRPQGVAEKIDSRFRKTEWIPIADALKILKHYGATIEEWGGHFHFAYYDREGVRKRIEDLTWNADDTRNVRLSILNQAVRELKAQQQGVAEGEQRVDSLVTDALKIMQGATMNDAVAALKTVLGNREYNDRRGHYSFYVRQLMDMYGQQGKVESELNEFLDPQAVAQDPGLEREPTADVIFFGQMPRDFTADTVWEALEAVLPQEYPPGRNTQGHPTSNAERVTTEIAKHQGAVVTNKPLSVAQKLAKTFQTYGIKCKVNAKPGMNEGKADYNFDIEDLKRLERIRDLPTLKAQALALISKPSAKPMKPEKVEWFKNALERMNSPLKVIKLMYDLLLSGEGNAVVGSRSSMNPNSYRQRFSEQGVAEAEADSDGHSVDHADSGEYDYEGDQAKDQLNTIVRAARRLDGMLDDNENMPEWVQMKITNAADYIDTAADYIESNQEPELDEGDKIGNMDADKFDAAMARLKQLAGAGPLKTVYDPTKRVYRNVPVAVQPKK